MTQDIIHISDLVLELRTVHWTIIAPDSWTIRQQSHRPIVWHR